MHRHMKKQMECLCDKTQPQIPRIPSKDKSTGNIELKPLPRLPDATPMPPEFFRKAPAKALYENDDLPEDGDPDKTHPGLRRTFVNLGRAAFDEKPDIKPVYTSRISPERTFLLLKLCFVALAFCVCIHSIASFLPSGWSVFKKREPAIAMDAKMGAMLAARSFWDSCEEAPLTLKTRCLNMKDDEFTTVSDRFASIGTPSFDKAVVWADASTAGLYYVDVPVNGGTLSLIAREIEGVLTVSAFVGLNLN